MTAPSLSRDELSWVAGMFEGEGTVAIVGGGKRPYTRLVTVLVNTDPEIVAVFMRNWPAKTLRRVRKKSHQKVAWEWRLSCRKAAAFLRDVQPFVRTGRMHARIELALLVQASRRKGTQKNCLEYRAMQDQFKAQMHVLNKRGV